MGSKREAAAKNKNKNKNLQQKEKEDEANVPCGLHRGNRRKIRPWFHGRKKVSFLVVLLVFPSFWFHERGEEEPPQLTRFPCLLKRTKLAANQLEPLAFTFSKLELDIQISSVGAERRVIELFGPISV